MAIEERVRGSPLPDEVPPQNPQPLATIAVIAATVAALYFLREIFIPIALAVLLSFMLWPAVSRLRRWGVGRITATLVTVAIAALLIGGLMAVVATQLLDLANNLPTYEYNLLNKVRVLNVASSGNGVVKRTSELIKELGRELEQPSKSDQSTGSKPEGEREPIPVEVHPPKPSPLEVIGSAVWPLLKPVATAGVVVVFVIFILLYREDLRDRIIKLVSSGDLQRTTQAMSDAGERVTRYLLMQLVVNASCGLPIGIGLFFIGVPNPVLWGLLTVGLRFIPYIGPIIAASMPVAISVAIDPGWTMPLLSAGWFIVVETIIANAVEPWLYGSSTGISSLAIIVAAVFWTWLWGPIGLLLSTPLTVCLMVIGRYVPRLQFLYVMLGNAPVLAPSARFYQRALAHDSDEATEIAEEFLKEHTLEEVYDELVLPALALAERDRERNALTADALATVTETVQGVIDELGELTVKTGAATSNGATAQSPPTPPVDRKTPPVLCVGARSALDELAAAMLAQLLQRHGFPVARAAAAALESTDLPVVGGSAVKAVAVCSLHASAVLQIRRIARRLRPRLGEARLVAAIFNGRVDPAALPETLASTTADMMASGLRETVTLLERLALPAAEAEAEAAEQKASKEPIAEEVASPTAGVPALSPGEIEDDHAYLCHAYWQASEGGVDFVEAHRRNETLVALLAALSNESETARTLSAALRSLLRAAIEDAEGPVELLDLLEHELAARADSAEAIAAIALYYRPDSRILRIASAGNPEPILVRGDTAEPVPIAIGPTLLKRPDDNAVRPRAMVELVLEPGDRVLFYTEGAIEIINREHGFLEPSGLAAMARKNRGFAGMTFLERLAASLRAYATGEPEDDIVLLSIEVRDRGSTQTLAAAAD